MGDEVGSPEPLIEYPPVVRSRVTPAIPARRVPALRRPRELTLSSVILASGVALAVEGLRLAARARRNRSVDTQHESTPGRISVTYEWTHVTYERYERS